MKDRLREFRWQDTSLGGMSSWSPYLKGAVDVCMHCKFANMVLAGDEFLAFIMKSIVSF